MASASSSSVEQHVINTIDAYIKKNGGFYPEWYIGIAADPKQRLFKDHNVTQMGGLWIPCDCFTDTTARRVEQAFLKVGCKGGDGGGDRNTRYVYAYKITSSTRE